MRVHVLADAFVEGRPVEQPGCDLVHDRGVPSQTVRCYVEPSPAGGYFVRLRGETAPLSRHDTEEEAEAAAAAYDRGLSRADQAPELVLLDDGSEVLVRASEDAVRAFAGDAEVGVASMIPDGARPHIAVAAISVDAAWEASGLRDRLLRRLRVVAEEARIRELRPG
jgi:hypothetical protein